MRVHKSTCARRKHKDAPKERMKNESNKWKNHFYEMKGDVGMSLHEKERNKKMPTPRHKVITPSLNLCFFQDYNVHYHAQAIGCQDVVLFALPNDNKQHVKAKQRCRDGVMSDFVSWCRHLLVPFFFMK